MKLKHINVGAILEAILASAWETWEAFWGQQLKRNGKNGVFGNTKNAKNIFVFEPISECIEYIQKGYKSKNIEYHNKIVSNKDGIGEIHIPIILNEKIFGKS